MSMDIKSKKNIRPVLITGFLLALSLASTYIINQATEPSPFISTNILLLTLININITLVVVLLLLLSRNLIKVFLEKREKELGFRKKLILSFIGLTLIPCGLLFFIASGLLTNSIETGLSIQVERSLDASLEVAQDYYAHAQQTTERFTKQIGKELVKRDILYGNPTRLAAFLRASQEKYDADAIHLLTPQKHWIQSTWPNQEWTSGALFPSAGFPDKQLSSDLITRITSTPRGDIIRVIVPLSIREEKTLLVVDRLLPVPLAKKVEVIKRETEEYKQLKSFRRPIKKSYILSFSIVVLLIIFSATWFGFYLANGITGRIEKLSEGTAAVAQGNLDFHIDLKAHDELGILVSSFNKMTHDLKQSREALVRAEKIATWQEVALQMAHEIKNPLTPIQLATERLRRKYFERSPEFDAIFDESTQTVMNEVNGLVTLVNEFSNFARLPAVHLVSQDIKPALLEVIQLYQLGHKEIQFHLNFDETMPPLRIDRDQIKRVFINLFENAVEAAAHTLFIVTSFDPSTKQATLSVGDDGLGVAPEDIDHIFLPHFTRKKRGSGLGLAMVHRIVLDHGGHITVAARKPTGTTFTLLLPV